MKIPSKNLLVALQSEFYGEALFKMASICCVSKARKAKVELLLELEIATKHKLIDYCHRHSITVPRCRADVIKGTVLGALFAYLPWVGLMRAVERETHHYIATFKALKTESSTEDELFQYVVDHELAIQRFARLELVGDHKGAARTISQLL